MSIFGAPERTFSTGPRLQSWIVPVVLLMLGAVPLVAAPGRVDVAVVCGLLLVGGLLGAFLVGSSYVRVVGSDLMVRHQTLRPGRLRLDDLNAVAMKHGGYGAAPSLELSGGAGQTLTIRLGSWRRESELLGVLARAVDGTGASVDEATATILLDRPDAAAWANPHQRPPRTRVGRGFARLPSPIRFALQMAGVVVFFIGVYVAFDRASWFSETVLFPPHVDTAWSAPVTVAPMADTWTGNVAVLGGRMVVAFRDDIRGFWGTLRTRSSVDGGVTWSEPVTVSRALEAARHTLVAASDGSVFAAWAKAGPIPLTQKLVLRRSADGGMTWTPEMVVAVPRGGTLGIPALAMSDAVHMIVYTDGVTGEIWSQPLDRTGAPDGNPTRIDTTTRHLYSDSDLKDGRLALTTVGSRAVLAYVHDERDVQTAISDDNGRTWRATEIDQDLYSARPRLATDGTTVVLAVTDPNTGSRNVRHPFIRIWWSRDTGATWERGPDVTDVAGLGSVDLTWFGGRWRLLYDACPGAIRCVTESRLWYATSADASAWSAPGVLTEPGRVAPIGIAPDRTGVVALWGTVRSDHDWSIVTSKRPEP